MIQQKHTIQNAQCSGCKGSDSGPHLLSLVWIHGSNIWPSGVVEIFLWKTKGRMVAGCGAGTPSRTCWQTRIHAFLDSVSIRANGPPAERHNYSYHCTHTYISISLIYSQTRTKAEDQNIFLCVCELFYFLCVYIHLHITPTVIAHTYTHHFHLFFNACLQMSMCKFFFSLGQNTN